MNQQIISMKRIVALSVFVLFVAVGFNATAQLSKSEKKRVEKENQRIGSGVFQNTRRGKQVA